MDEKRLNLLAQAYKMQRDQALEWHAASCVELTSCRDEIEALNMRLNELEKTKTKRRK